MTENLPKLVSDTNPQIQKAQRTQQDKCQKTMPKHIIFKSQKVKDKGKNAPKRGVGRKEKTLPIMEQR